MINMFNAQNRMNRIYRAPKDSIYNHRFFHDLCSGYSYILGEGNDRRDFFAFEPEGCKISKLIMEEHYYNLSYSLEQVIDCITYSLLVFGKAYVYLSPKYTVSSDEQNNKNMVLTSIHIEEIKGYVKKRNKTKMTFCRKGFNGAISDMDIQSNQLIEFDIKDLGWRKRYFTNISKKLAKCDITSLTTLLLEKNLDGYDFSIHSEKNKIRELRASKDIGWSLGVDGLSDSYILYKKIQQDMLRLNFLNYILDKLNWGFETLVNDAGGKLVAHIKEKNYNQLWKDYTDGRITATELTDILYHRLR